MTEIAAQAPAYEDVLKSGRHEENLSMFSILPGSTEKNENNVKILQYTHPSLNRLTYV